MTKIYLDSDDMAKTYDDKPFSKTHLAAACVPGGPSLAWYNDYEKPAWHPYVIRVLKIDTDSTLHFRFIKSDQSATGPEEVPADCTVNLKTRDDVWIKHPSSIGTTPGPPAAGKEYGFLFLSKDYEDRTPPAVVAGYFTKWPKGSDGVLVAIKCLIDKAVAAAKQLPAEDQNLLKQYLSKALQS